MDKPKDNKMNNSTFGFMFQNAVCKKFSIKIESSKAKANFEKNVNLSFQNIVNDKVNEIFDNNNIKPIKCTTLSKDENGKPITYNFLLDNDKTLSIKTNIDSFMVAPRKLGQAGYAVLNQYFSEIYGGEIKTQADIRKLIYKHIYELLPYFVNALFDADYLLWIYKEKEEYKHQIFDCSTLIQPKFAKSRLKFTRKLKDWTESIDLKYKGQRLANIQTHSKRTFKFRFNMKTLLTLVTKDTINNETVGMSAEKGICNLFNLPGSDNITPRTNNVIVRKFTPLIKSAFKSLPKAIEYTGSKPNPDGSAGLCPYDFVLEGNKTLSLKTDKSDKLCPPKIGQPGQKRCYECFKDFIKEDHMDRDIFKRMVYDNIEKMLPMYLSELLSSDYLLILKYKNKDTPTNYIIVDKGTGDNFIWNRSKITFSRDDIAKWNVSNVVYYDGKPIGEFEVHISRISFKFRFYISNLLELIC